MLQGLTRKVKGWLQGSAPDGAAAAPSSTSPSTGAAVPEAAARLHQVALESLRNGEASDALASANQAIALAPRYPEAHNAAGLALRALGRMAEAAESFQRAVDIRPDHVPALSNHGIACLELGRFEEAEDSFKLALALDPGSVDICLHLAMSSWNRRRVDEAIVHFRRAIELDPLRAEAHVGLCGLLHAEGRLEQAVEGYRAALATGLNAPELELNCGLTLLKLKRIEEAIAHFEHALAAKPDFAEAYFNLGNAYGEQEKRHEALACYRRAIDLKPDYADPYSNMGSVLKEQGAVTEALECYRKAVAIDPGKFEARHNLGVLLGFMGRRGEALACYEEAQRLNPGHPESQLNLAITQLLAGDFARGWQNYEARFRQTGTENKAAPREYPFPLWEGQPLAGKRVLVWGEQGIGDEITFSCMYREVVEASQECVIECASKLVPLFARSFPGARVVGKASPPHPSTPASLNVLANDRALDGLDYHSPAGGLARWLRPGLESFPQRRGHLVAAPERVSYWKGRLAALGPGLKVGFSWRSHNVAGDRALHFAELERWTPIFRVPGVRFVCLQYDESRAELARAAELAGTPLHSFPEVDLFNDLDEAAALTQALDLVISAPTAVSLLSAGLGVPTWQMSWGADWQIHGTDRNPWYPAMTQFKLVWDRKWDEVLELVAQRLSEVAVQRLRELADRGVNAAEAAGTTASHHDADPPPAAAGSIVAHRGVEDALAVKDALARGDGLLRENRLGEAADHYERAAAEAPDNVTAHLKLGIVRYQQGQLDAARAANRRVLELQPGHIAARVNDALVQYQSGDFDAAVAGFEAVLKEEPDHPDAHFNLSLALLARSEFARGWEEYEWRFAQEALEERARTFPFPRWNGEDLTGKTVLVWKEQSVGTQLVFAGMLPELIERAGFCIIECTPKLAPLFARSFPDCDVVPRTEPPHPYTQHGVDFQVPSGSLARWLRQSLESFPRHHGYLRADPQRVDHWRRRLAMLGSGPKIGFSWRSINVQAERGLSCTRLEQWAPVMRAPGAHFVCLQYDDCSSELAAAQAQFGVPLHRFGDLDLFNDLDESAALTRALDLVISAPTAVTDLSAGLGVPTWRLDYGAEWKMHGARYHPWFPDMRRYCRGLYQPWEEIMVRIGEDLHRAMAAGAY